MRLLKFIHGQRNAIVPAVLGRTVRIFLNLCFLLILLSTSAFAEPPEEDDDAFMYNHISIDASGVGYSLFPENKGLPPYLGVAVLPEFKYSRSLNNSDLWRFFFGARWTGINQLTAATRTAEDPKPLKGKPATQSEAILVTGLNVVINPRVGQAPINIGVNRFYFGVGYGNFLVEADDKYLQGWAFITGFELEVVSFNFADPF